MNHSQGKSGLRVGIYDESPFILYSIQAILIKEHSDLDINIYAIEAKDLQSDLSDHIPDILITDFSFSFERNNLNSVRKLGQLQKNNPDLKIIIFTAQKSQAILKGVLQLPVSAIVHKCDDIRDLVKAFDWVCSSKSETYYSEQMRSLLLPAPAEPVKTILTPSEIEVIRLYASGYSLMEIAKSRKRSISTVATQKYNAMRKLQLQSNTDLIKYVFAKELI